MQEEDDGHRGQMIKFMIYVQFVKLHDDAYGWVVVSILICQPFSHGMLIISARLNCLAAFTDLLRFINVGHLHHVIIRKGVRHSPLEILT